MENIFKKIVAILKKHGAGKVSLFGSYARGEAKAGSDIDLIVGFKKQKSLLELVSIEREISEKTGRKIDLLTEKSVSPYISKRISAEKQVLY